ncbi:MAG: septation protein A [Candidatus Methylumidiphilus sp.]
MKLLFDFFPILLFFIAYKIFDIYVATAVAIAASFAQVGYSWFKTRKIETMHLVTLVIIVVFGGLTLYLQDEQFIKWKPTVINWLFGFAFLSSQWLGEKTMIERMMGATAGLSLPGAVWRNLNLSWTLFFFVLGGVNWYVMSNFDTATWVNFKLFGMLGLTLLFVVLQSIYLSRHLPEPQAEQE